MSSTHYARVWLGLTVALLGANTAAAHDKACDTSPLTGTWTLNVTPQPHPDVEVIPPPFTSLIVFETGGTLTETDTALHPTSKLPLFPEFGPLSSSDGLGAWVSDGGNRYHGQFVKNLFDASGQHFGYLIVRIAITLRGQNRLDARSVSDFVRGTDLDAEPFFSNGVALVTATRLRAD